MDRNVWVINLLGITNRQLTNGPQVAETLCLIYALYYKVACRSSNSFSRDFIVWRLSCAEVLLKTQSGDVSFVKQACVLSRNEIGEILMDSDRRNITHHRSRRTKSSHSHLRWSYISQPFVLTETVFRIIIKDQLIRHLFVRPPYKQLKPRPQYK
jgi:hypothetical protein